VQGGRQAGPIPLVLCLLWPGGAVRFRRD